MAIDKFVIDSSPTEKLESTVKSHGFSVLVAVLFVSGENAGCALLALPRALDMAGWSGIFMIIFGALNAAVAGVLLAKCWIMVEERYEQYRGECQYPYPAIGLVTYGPKMRYLVSFCIHFTLIGSSVVVLLICAELMMTIFIEWTQFSYGIWILIVSFFLWPLMMLRTPSEFWPAAAGAIGTTTIAVLLILYQMADVYSQSNFAVSPKSKVTVSNFFLAMGTIMFAFGGTAAFPTFQNCMKKREDFPKAVIFGFLILVLLYVPIAAMGYIVFGQTVNLDVILSLPSSPSKTVSLLLMSGHLFFAFLLLVNAPIQEVEKWFNLPKSFSWSRFLIRTSMLSLCIFIGQTIPNFGKVLDLIGGSTISMLTYILPPIFYMKLKSEQLEVNPNYPDQVVRREIPFYQRLFFYQIVIISIIGGSACTYSALIEIFSPHAFVTPCYIDPACHTIMVPVINSNTTL